MTPFSQQQRYWAELVQLKAQASYLNAYHLECEKCDNALKMILAIASNSSIATWAIWQRLGILWGVIIALSQVVNAIKHLLPWERRAKELANLGRDVADILLVAERDWYRVAEGLWTEEEINDSIAGLRRRRSDAENQHLAGRPLPENRKHMLVAVEHTTKYFKAYYGIGG